MYMLHVCSILSEENKIELNARTHTNKSSRSLSIFNDILPSMIFTAYKPRLCFDMVLKMYC